MWTRIVVWDLLRLLVAGRAALVAENLALRQQLAVMQRAVPRPKLRRRDRISWVWLSSLWTGWRSALIIVQPNPSSGGIGRASGCIGDGRVAVEAMADPPSPAMSATSSGEWPRPIPSGVHPASTASCSSSASRSPRPRSPSTCRDAASRRHPLGGRSSTTTSANSLPSISSPCPRSRSASSSSSSSSLTTADECSTSTSPSTPRRLDGTADPRSVSLGHRAAIPPSRSRRHLRWRLRARRRSMGIEQVLTAARAPWQNPYCERLIGSIRRECLDHVIVLDEQHLRRVLQRYFGYYHRSRTHLSLAKDAPEPRGIEPPECGGIVEIPEVGGLHHRYSRRAA